MFCFDQEEDLDIFPDNIPSGTKSLSFSRSLKPNFCKAGIESGKLIQFIKAIPTSVTQLGLEFILYRKRGLGLAQIFAAIPRSIANLKLYDNELGLMSSKELAQALAAIPPSVIHLDLSGNKLGWMSSEELAQALAAIPTSVIHLDLSNNELYLKKGNELVQIMSAIPASIIHLSLKGNNLVLNVPNNKFAQALAAIPTSVAHLDLSNNGLYLNKGNELVQIMSAIPASITHLSLKDNELGRISLGNSLLAQALAAIPTSVTHLDLSNNDLHNKERYKLTNVLQLIEYQGLDISASVLQRRLLDGSWRQLIPALTQIPPTVIYINLRNNSIFSQNTPEERDIFIDKLCSINTHGRLDLVDNGEKAYIRAASLLINIMRNGIFNQRSIPIEIINEIAYWLGAPNKNFFNKNNFFNFVRRPPITHLTEAAVLSDCERPKRLRTFIESEVEIELDSPQQRKRHKS